MSILKGTSLVGCSPTGDRAENDYYATPFESTEAILQRETLGITILEPACGEGHMSKIIKDYYPNAKIVSCDLIQRDDKFDLGIIGGVDFLTAEFGRKFDTVITNPPYAMAKDFVERALELSTNKVLMFLKIQFLEGQKRKKFLQNSPLKYVYVFSERQNPMRNGNDKDENGKPWSSTMCFAWFVWEHGYEGEPVIRWI